MSSDASDENPSGLACPECLTFNPLDAATCAHCHQSLKWVHEISRWQQALSLPRAAQLEVDVLWLGTTRHLTLKPHDQQEVPLGEGASLDIAFDGNPFQCQVQRAAEQAEITLPGSHILGDVEIRARTVCVSHDHTSVPAIEKFCSADVSIDVAAPLTLGRRSDGKSAPCMIVPDSAVEMEHALFVFRYLRDDSNGRQHRREFWIADLDTPEGTFVDRKPVVAQRLVGGNLIQIDGYAWIFNEEDGRLIAVEGINGADLRISQVGVEDRLAPVSLSIASGQLVAIAGQSGAGKSTLMHTILGNVRGQASGTVSVGGIPYDVDAEAYRAQLGFVPQDEVLHTDLTVQQSIAYRARLRRESSSPTRQTSGEIPELLGRLEVPRARWEALPTQLSGGESKRARIASELISKPRLLLLDEPASGLDQGREIQLMRLLRGLSLQGCTVVVVTHGLAHLEYFDRVLLLRKGELKFDGTPSQLRERIPTGEFTDLDLAEPPVFRDERVLAAEVEQASKPLENTASWHQFRVIIDREKAKVFNRLLFTLRLPTSVGKVLTQFGLFGRKITAIRLHWLWLPILLVPAFFALALHFGIRSDDQYVLPFFAVLASIWMGASLSLLSIVNERISFEHERVLFLHLWPFVAAKTISLWLISVAQTVVFVGLLWGLRTTIEAPGLPDVLFTTSILMMTGWSAVGMGMVVSAFSGTSSSIANFLLPLLMILQIVFSAEVAGKGGALELAYGSFHLHACDGKTDCIRRVEYRVPTNGEWLCEVCRGKLKSCHTASDDGRPGSGIGLDVSPEVRQCLDQNAHKSSSYDEGVNRDLPTPVAIAISYATLSRYGDMALRSLEEVDPTTHEQYGYRRWFWEAFGRLFLLTIALPGVTWLVLGVQSSKRHRRARRHFAQLLSRRKQSDPPDAESHESQRLKTGQRVP